MRVRVCACVCVFSIYSLVQFEVARKSGRRTTTSLYVPLSHLYSILPTYVNLRFTFVSEMLHILSTAITLAQYAVTVVQYISVSNSVVFVYVG